MRPERLASVCLLLAVVACNVPGSASAPEGQALDRTSEAGTDQADSVNPGQDSTQAGEAERLIPAPLYYISSDNQIWRIETDGKTTTQVTFEPVPVEQFDVSRVNGSIVYVAGRTLYTADAFGSGRTERFTAPPDPQYPDQPFAANPIWSPITNSFAYTYEGIAIYDLATGSVQQLLQGDPVPNLEDLNYVPSDPPPGSFSTINWSPDGTRLLINTYVYFSDNFSVEIYEPARGTRTSLSSPGGIICCYPAWSPDGAALYLSSDVGGGYVETGLWRIDTGTGEGATLVSRATDSGATNYVSYAAALSDGQLYSFRLTTAEVPDWPRQSMYRSDLDGVTNLVALRSDSYYFSELVWASDGSGAAVIDLTPQTGGETSPEYPFSGQILWLMSDGSPAVILAPSGRSLRWGK